MIETVYIVSKSGVTQAVFRTLEAAQIYIDRKLEEVPPRSTVPVYTIFALEVH
jgi:hypothetical protein